MAIRSAISVLFVFLPALGLTSLSDVPWRVTAAAEQRAGATAFRSGAELVALNVTVTGPDGQHVPGLTRDDFVVYDEGVPQEITFFAASDVPLDLVVMIDTSSSMRHRMASVRRAASGFVRTLRGDDRAQVVAFSERVRILEPFTGDVPALEAAIARAVAMGGTSFHTALYVVLQELTGMALDEPSVRRQAVVVLSDGYDTASLLSFEVVLECAQRSGVAIYPISLVPYSDDERLAAPMLLDSTSEYSLRLLARETGGQAHFPVNLAELDGVYGQIAQELATQYSIGYVPRNPAADGRFRQVIVQLINHPDTTLRTRSGYYAAVTPGGSSGR